MEKEHVLGSEIVIKGQAADVRNVYSSGNLSVTGQIGKLKLFEKILETNGTFEFRYKTSLFDIEGNLTVNITFSDISGNSGSLTKTTLLKIVSEGGFYALKFLSPAPNFVYKRGDQIKLTVAVEKEGERVEGGNFTLRPPDGSFLFLKEVSSGIYSGDYKLPFYSAEGQLPLYVVGFKEIENKTIAGAAQIPINVEKALINLEIISPIKVEVGPDQPVEITVKALYLDGSFAENLDISALSPSGEKIFLAPEGDKYVARYTLKENETGIWKLQVEASDPYKNSGTKLLKLKITDITILYYIIKNLGVVAISGAVIILVSGCLLYRNKKINFVKNLKTEEKKIFELKKEAQKKYFNDSSIDKSTYQELMKKYEERGADVRKKLSAAKIKTKAKK